MFEWDRNNLRKIRTHRISRDEAEQALLNDPIPVYEPDVDGESQFVYYGESSGGRFACPDRNRARQVYPGRSRL
jgi:hypothetical protein